MAVDEPDDRRGVYGISVAAELVGMGVQNLRLYANVRNIGFISSWKFWDPENGTNGATNQNLTYSVPSPRIFTMGVDITL